MSKLFLFIVNKYAIVSLLFVVWLAFFDQNDWMTMKQRKSELNAIKDNIAFLKSEINRMNSEKSALVTDMNGNLNKPEILERYARERFRMRHEGEDVYVIED
jgi:cell division protein DivIC